MNKKELVRENKFRSFNEKWNIYFYFKNGKYYRDPKLEHCISETPCDEFDWENAEQFTGLKDKTNREIYEGDIIETWNEAQTKNFVSYVGFQDGVFVLFDYISEVFSQRLESAVNFSHPSIIGNFENKPNLKDIL